MQSLQLQLPTRRGHTFMPRLTVLLLSVLARLLAAQNDMGRKLQEEFYDPGMPPFPDDRENCHSSDPSCMVGTRWMADEFSIRVPTYIFPQRGFTGKPVAEAVAEGDITYLLPEGYEHDFSGGLEAEPARYTSPDRYVGYSGDTFFPSLNVTVVVNDTHLVPSHISIMPGTTVSWDLKTYETVNVRSNDNGASFSSGPINRIWASLFSLQFNTEGTFPYRNVEVPSYQGGFEGTITVAAYNCSLYTSCTTCLLYDMCLWCPSNGTCHERNTSTNIPLDTGPVISVAPQEEYEAARYMFGYNTRAATYRFDWYPWPPFRRNPKPIPGSLIPSYYDPIASDTCTTYMRTRDAAQCEDIGYLGDRARVHGVETASRPVLEDFFACYAHVSETWARPDVPAPTPWTTWSAENATSNTAASDESQSESMWATTCCGLCASCSVPLLAACNITCDASGESNMGLIDGQSNATCPWDATQIRLMQTMCALRTDQGGCAVSGVLRNASHCSHLLATATTQLSGADSTLSVGASGITDSSAADGGMAMRGGQASASSRSGQSRPYRKLLSESNDETDPSAVLDTSFSDFASAPVVGLRQVPLSVPAAQVEVESVGVRRRTQFGAATVSQDQLTPWEQVPQKQKRWMGRITGATDLWATLYSSLEARYGPRCNVTHGCDRDTHPPRGRCLNISGLPVYGFDQNGTCTCHPWFGTRDCSQPIINNRTCIGMPDHQQCLRIREMLFLCGTVQANNYLPDICAQLGLTVVECGEAGYMHGQRNMSGISNLVGRPDSGYAALACSQCNSRGDMRSETFAKLCDPSTVLAACQRYEDATAQNLCNYCGAETQGSVLPQSGIDRQCSYYRGTCMGSVEKRIRGIVPPNLDIVGQTAYGGLRYCKQATTFTSMNHYYSDEDILLVGQACREGTTPAWEGWDWSKQHDNPTTVRDRFGTKCQDENDESTCPISRHCTHPNMCYTDTPDWLDMDELVRHMGLGPLRRYADDPSCNAYYSQGQIPPLPGQINADGQIIVPCMFTTHQVTLTPTIAGSFANWPFLSQEYLDLYTHVEWATEGRAKPPPPLPPPPAIASVPTSIRVGGERDT